MIFSLLGAKTSCLGYSEAGMWDSPWHCVGYNAVSRQELREGSITLERASGPTNKGASSIVCLPGG